MAAKTPGLSVVIPAYNEEKNIERTVKQILEFLNSEPVFGNFEVIVVDDGSTDRTVALVENLASGNPDLKLLKNSHHGKGYTVRTGVLAARGDYILFSDADGSTPIKELKRLFLWLTEHNFDIVIASREGLGAERHREPYYRHLMGRGFNLLVQLLALPGIHDSQCGFKLLKTPAAREVFSRMKIYGDASQLINFAYTGAFDVEVLYLARKFGYKIKEIPVSWTYNRTERVSPLRDSWRMFKDVCRIRLNDFRGAYQ